MKTKVKKLIRYLKLLDYRFILVGIILLIIFISVMFLSKSSYYEYVRNSFNKNTEQIDATSSEGNIEHQADVIEESSVENDIDDKEIESISEEDVATSASESKQIDVSEEIPEETLIADENIQLDTLEDKAAPVIEEIICDFTAMNVDIPIEVTISIKAYDDKSDVKNLKYAVTPKGKGVREKDYFTENIKKFSFSKNGIYVIYCMDEAGNVSKEEKELILVDMVAPKIRSIESSDTKICREATIIVHATDKTEIQYRYTCPEKEIDSGFTYKNTFNVTENGIYFIEVMDSALNTSAGNIEISNIDRNLPVIKGITERGVSNNE